MLIEEVKNLEQLRMARTEVVRLNCMIDDFLMKDIGKPIDFSTVCSSIELLKRRADRNESRIEYMECVLKQIVDAKMRDVMEHLSNA